MIVELEKMKQHRTILAAHMYTLHDGLSEDACAFAVKMMDREIAKLEGGKYDKGTEAGPGTEGSS